MSEKYKVQYSNQSKLGLDQGMKGLDLENVHIHFMAYSLTGKDLRFMSKIEPGIFITGGTARAMALKEICHIPETEITTSTDIDWLTLGNRHIYIRQQKLIDSQRTITFRPDMVQTLSNCWIVLMLHMKRKDRL